MRNYNLLFALLIFILMSLLVLLTNTAAPIPTYKVIRLTLPLSKGCAYPTREVVYTKTEIKHIVPQAQIHKCHYDKSHRLVRVSTYNFEKGYQMKMPTEEVLYEWDNHKLTQYSTRRADHGGGQVDVEVYRLTN